jgi:hypothetical protein
MLGNDKNQKNKHSTGEKFLSTSWPGQLVDFVIRFHFPKQNLNK